MNKPLQLTIALLALLMLALLPSAAMADLCYSCSSGMESVA